MVSDRSLFGAERSRALARRGGQQDLALARSRGRCGAPRSRHQPRHRAARERLERPLSCAGAVDATRNASCSRLRPGELAQARTGRTGAGPLLVLVTVRWLEIAADPGTTSRCRGRFGPPCPVLAGSSRLEATWSHRAGRAAEWQNPVAAGQSRTPASKPPARQPRYARPSLAQPWMLALPDELHMTGVVAAQAISAANSVWHTGSWRWAAHSAAQSPAMSLGQ